MSQDNPEDAFVLGGLWSSQDSPPVSTGVEAVVKRVFKTGVEEGLAHEVEFDDLEQSITITSSTNQTVTIDPDKIELSNEAGTLVDHARQFDGDRHDQGGQHRARRRSCTDPQGSDDQHRG